MNPENDVLDAQIQELSAQLAADFDKKIMGELIDAATQIVDALGPSFEEEYKDVDYGPVRDREAELNALQKEIDDLDQHAAYDRAMGVFDDD